MSQALSARLVFAFVASAAALRAQSQLDWISYHDSIYSQTDFGRVIAVDASGDVYVTGRSYNPSVGIPPMPPTSDIELTKFSPSGATLWSAHWDTWGNDDVGLDVQVAPSGDVYVSGYAWNGNDIELVLLKYSAAGAYQWHAVFSSPGGSDFGRAIAFDASGNILVCGNSYGTTSGSDVLVLSFAPNGALNWSTSFDGGTNGSDTAYAMHVLPSGEIAVAGQVAHATQGLNFAAWKLSSTGGVLWSRQLDGGSSGTDGATIVVPWGANRLAFGGWRTSATGEDWMLARLDLASGTPDWSVFSNGTANANDRVRSIAVDAKGVLWSTGSSSGSGSGVDFVTERFDASGARLSTHRWNNNVANLDDQPFKLLLGSAGQAFVCGYTTYSVSSPGVYDGVVLQYDSAGALSWDGVFSSPGLFDDRVFDAELAPANKIALGGYTTFGPSGGYDYMAMQIDVGDSPWGYCTAKTNTLGCTASLSFAGASSASSASGFTIACSNVRNQKSGLLFYSVTGATGAPFQGGYMCMLAPTGRTPLANSGGSALPSDDCSGVFSIDMNAFAAGALGGFPFPALSTPGTAVFCEQWSRDPGASFNTNLSSALRYIVLP